MPILNRILTEKKPIKIWCTTIDDGATQQLKNIANLNIIHSHVSAMADCHMGYGSSVGTVIATKGSIIPSAVGVDIGCGMMAVKLPFKIDELKNLHSLRDSIENMVPVGFSGHQSPIDFVFDWDKSPELIKENEKEKENVAKQMGTLGGGNHFIEICKDDENDCWVMLHSGSRGIGKKLAEIHIDKAKNLMKEYFIELPDPNLSYLVESSQEFKNYINDLRWAQDYALNNRNEMMKLCLKEVSFHVYGFDKEFYKDKSLFSVNCHHNYSRKENHFGKNVWITRKGAVSAREGEYGIIPGSMGACSYIVKGKGNLESFCSCSHGAGRNYGRNEAKKLFTIDDFIKQTEGVECSKDEKFIDEIPSAYKNIDEVMSNQSDLVEIVYKLKQLICIKG